MSTEDPQEIWNDYYRRKKIQRMDGPILVKVKLVMPLNNFTIVNFAEPRHTADRKKRVPADDRRYEESYHDSKIVKNYIFTFGAFSPLFLFSRYRIYRS